MNYYYQRRFAIIVCIMQDNPGFSKQVQSGQFYFMDKFLLLASGSFLLLYKYHIDATKNDVQRSVHGFGLTPYFNLCLTKTE